MVTEPIISIDFKDGQYIKKGRLLALDPSTYQAQLDQAEANFTRDEAHLENGRIDLGRYVPLAKEGGMSSLSIQSRRYGFLRPAA